MEYRIQYFSNDMKCWVDNDSGSLINFYCAVNDLKSCASSHPDMPHRLVKIDTVALSANGETLIGSIG